MLEGLEASIQNYKSLNRIIDYRIEAEYFDKRFLHIDSIFEQTEYVTFFDVAGYENGRAYSSDEFLDGKEGIKVAKIGDVTQKRINENWIAVSHREFQKQNGHFLTDGDILMTLTGDPPDVGKVNLFISNGIDSTWNQRVARIYLNEEQTAFINQNVFYITLASRYCREQLERYAKGIRQRNLGVECIEKLKLPILKHDSQIYVDSLTRNSFEKLNQSQFLYREAEELLLAAIGLKDFTPREMGTNIKQFKESFSLTGRLDSEYYLPKYEDIIAIIKAQPHDNLNVLVSIKKSIEPGSDVYSEDGLPFIRVSDYNKFGISKPEKCLSLDYYNSNSALLESLYPTKGTILFSKDGSVGIAYMVTENMQAITSGAILHLTVIDEAKILPEYLTLVLNSDAIKQQAERDAGGSIILHWRISEIENVIVPIVPYAIQQRIASLIRESFAFRQESEQLLDEAKRMVEIEIEDVMDTK